MNHYSHITYDSKWRFVSYWHQTHEILAVSPSRVLEIGIGNGFVSHYLRRAGTNITTCDLNPAFAPDVVADISKLPFANNSFDVATAYEVLEHIPYQDVPKALRELARVSSRWAIVSLPEATPFVRFDITLPKLGRIKKLISIPFFAKTHIPRGDDPHQWEIGKKNFPLSRIVADMREAGFTLTKTYRIFEYPRHRFFILEKKYI